MRAFQTGTGLLNRQIEGQIYHGRLPTWGGIQVARADPPALRLRGFYLDLLMFLRHACLCHTEVPDGLNPHYESICSYAVSLHA